MWHSHYLDYLSSCLNAATNLCSVINSFRTARPLPQRRSLPFESDNDALLRSTTPNLLPQPSQSTNSCKYIALTPQVLHEHNLRQGNANYHRNLQQAHFISLELCCRTIEVELSARLLTRITQDLVGMTPMERLQGSSLRSYQQYKGHCEDIDALSNGQALGRGSAVDIHVDEISSIEPQTPASTWECSGDPCISGFSHLPSCIHNPLYLAQEHWYFPHTSVSEIALNGVGDQFGSYSYEKNDRERSLESFMNTIVMEVSM
jgi:hypothetical protein